MEKRMKKYIAEFIGTLILVLFGCGTAAAVACDPSSPDAAYLLTALAFGISLTAMVYCIGHISGCHINPAVSLAMFLDGRLRLSEFGGYLAAQFLGGIAGAGMIGLLLGADNGYGANSLYDGEAARSLLAELVLTFVFVLVVLAVTSQKNYEKIAGIVIGLTLTLVHIFGIHFTGTSVNPARSFGPAIFARGDALSGLWVFILAPLFGGALAAVVWKLFRSSKKSIEE